MFHQRKIYGFAAACGLMGILGPTELKAESQPTGSFIAPLPGLPFQESIQATALRTGAVELRWWLPAPGAVDIFIRRREILPAVGDWQEIGRAQTDQFVDRNTRSGRTYEYEIEADGLRVHGGGHKAGISATVDSVLPPFPIRRFEVYHSGEALRAEWELERETRLGRLVLSGSRGDDTWIPITEISDARGHHEWPAEPGGFSRFRVEAFDIGSSQPSAVSEAPLTGKPRTEQPLATFRPHPRLFLNEADIEALKTASREDARLGRALGTLVAEAVQVLTKLKNGNRSLPRKQAPEHQKIAVNIRQLALAWVFTGREEFRSAAVGSLLEYASFYAELPVLREHADGRLTSQTLNEAMLTVNIAWAYDLLRPTLNDQEAEQVQSGLLRPLGQVLLRRDRGRSNWQSWHNAGLLCLGIVLGDSRMTDQVLHGDTGIFWQLRNTLGRDGLYYAQSIAYQYFAMHAFTISAAVATANGLDLFSHHEGERSLRTMYDAPFYHAFSNGNQAPFGNSQVNYTLAMPFIAWTYAFAYHHFKDPKYLWLWLASEGEERANDSRMPVAICLWKIQSAGGPRGSFPDSASPLVIGTGRSPVSAIRNIAGSTLLEDVGMAVLRGSTVTPGGEGAMIWKPHGKTAGHQHANSLGIYWQSQNHRWISGSGKWASYSSDLHEKWVMQTLSDNTLLVGRKSHAPLEDGSPYWVTDEEGKPSGGELTAFTAGTDFGFVQAFNNRVYDHALLTRRFIVTDSYAVDISEVQSSKETTFDTVLHISGDLQKSDVSLKPSEEPLGQGGGYEYLTPRRTGVLENRWNTEWISPDGTERLHLTILTPGAAIGQLALTPWADNKTRSTVLVSQQGRSAQFVSVIRATKESDPVVSVEMDETALISNTTGKLNIRQQSGWEDVLVWSDRASETSWGDIGFAGQNLMLRRTSAGQAVGATIVRGYRLSVESNLGFEFEFPATWSWRRLPGDEGFILLYDDVPPAKFRVRSDRQYHAWLLDARGKVTTQTVPKVPEEPNTWLLSPRSNMIFSSQESPPAHTVPLTKTIQ